MEFQSWLLFAFVMKHLLNEMLLLLLKQLPPRNLLNGCCFFWTLTDNVHSWGPWRSRLHAFPLPLHQLRKTFPRSDTWQHTKPRLVFLPGYMKRVSQEWLCALLLDMRLFFHQFLSFTFSPLKDISKRALICPPGTFWNIVWSFIIATPFGKSPMGFN